MHDAPSELFFIEISMRQSLNIAFQCRSLERGIRGFLKFGFVDEIDQFYQINPIDLG